MNLAEFFTMKTTGSCWEQVRLNQISKVLGCWTLTINLKRTKDTVEFNETTLFLQVTPLHIILTHGTYENIYYCTFKESLGYK